MASNLQQQKQSVKKQEQASPIFKMQLKMTAIRPVSAQTAKRSFPTKRFFARNVASPKTVFPALIAAH
jgi:hypothetical protein